MELKLISKTVRKVFFLFVLLVSSPIGVQAAEVIENYLTEIDVQADSSLIITENITVIAEGNEIKRGIYRDFPTNYEDRFGHSVVVDFQVLGVLRNGQPEEYFTEKHGNGVRTYIGKKSVLIPHGRHVYQIKYRTNRQLGYFEDHDELYFNAIGHGFVFPIKTGGALIRLPNTIPRDKVSADGYSGPQGSKGRNFKVQKTPEGEILYTLTSPLQSMEGLTVFVSWPKGYFAEPTSQEKSIYFLRDNSATLAGLIGMLLVFSYYWFTWKVAGKDPEKGTIIPQYKAPEGLTAAGAYFITKMEMSNKCLSATITDLAVRGYLTISQHKSTYTLHKLKKSPKDLNKLEQGVITALFGLDSTQIILDDTNYKKPLKALQNIEVFLRNKHLGTTFVANKSYPVFGFFFSLLVVAAMVVVAQITATTDNLPSLANAVILLLLILALPVFSFLIKQPTVAGRKILDQLEGYKMYLETAERDRFDQTGFPPLTPEVYEHHLPFAIALGVEVLWTKIFQKALTVAGSDSSYHPAWYNGSTPYFSSSGPFSGGLTSSGLTGAIASASTPPGSSSGGGDSGSSGGGGGGGGGGGW